MRCLVFQIGEDVLRNPLPGQEVRLGSDPSNDLVVSAVGVSRFHARFVPAVPAPRLYDLGSKNGLVVEGNRLREVTLHPGVRVQAGSALIWVDDGETADVDLFLEPRVPWGVDAAEGRVAGNATETFGLFAGEGDALGFLRELDRNAGTALSEARTVDLLGRLCQAVGADGAALLRRVEGELVPIVVGGHAPDATHWRDLAARQPPAGAVIHLKGAERELVVRSSAEAGAVVGAVAFPPGVSPAGWRSELVDVTLEALLTGRPLAAQERPASSRASMGLVVPDGMVWGGSRAMKDLRRRLEKIAPSRSDVLVLGETGVGKELVARLIHASGPTSRGPFVALNCAAIPSELLEAELFGVRPRAATGVDGRPGRIREADGGTLVLDEIGELPASLQAKLLRFLQEREIQAVGGTGSDRVNVRVVSVSNRDLAGEVRSGRFRADLFHRVRGLECRVPPLRERREDLPDLVGSFADRAATEEGKRVRGISRKAMAALMAHDWPGNIRELNVEVRRAVVLCPDGGSLTGEHFGDAPWLGHRRGDALASTAESAPPPELAEERPSDDCSGGSDLDLRRGVDRLESSLIRAALERSEGNRTQAATLLGLTRAGLRMKMKRLFGDG
jgi:DNA-binding NtrC family response regulator